MKINYNLLKQMCNSPIKTFYSVGDVKDTKDGIYIYKSRPENKVLAVAHLDTVLNQKHFYKTNRNKDVLVFNACLDDRLGVYTILDLLPQLNIHYDILLTEGEESGNSTAQYFEAEKSYNWMFSFDRRGEDVVMYQYDDEPTRGLLKSSGFKPAIGSFSDIAFLEHLQIKGFNIGTGYEGEHTSTSYASMNVLTRQVQRFQHFYEKNKDIKLAHIPTSQINYGYHYQWGKYDDLYCYLCAKNRGEFEVDDGIYLCGQCFNDAEMCQHCQDIVYNYELTTGLCKYCLI